MTNRIETAARSAASPGEVFAVLADGACWPQWGAWIGFELAETDAHGGEGPGAVRVLTSRTLGRTIASRERILEVVPDRLIRYELLSGLPLQGYVGAVELTPDGAGTRIRWTATFDRATPGTAWFYRRVLQSFIADAATRVARYSEERRVRGTTGG